MPNCSHAPVLLSRLSKQAHKVSSSIGEEATSKPMVCTISMRIAVSISAEATNRSTSTDIVLTTCPYAGSLAAMLRNTANSSIRVTVSKATRPCTA